MRSTFPSILEALTILFHATTLPALTTLIEAFRNPSSFFILTIPAATFLSAGLPCSEAFTILGFTIGLHTATLDDSFFGVPFEEVVDFPIFYPIMDGVLKNMEFM
jgi:hypothetical protein